jgi:hypothetical protein
MDQLAGVATALAVRRSVRLALAGPQRSGCCRCGPTQEPAIENHVTSKGT